LNRAIGQCDGSLKIQQTEYVGLHIFLHLNSFLMSSYFYLFIYYFISKEFVNLFLKMRSKDILKTKKKEIIYPYQENIIFQWVNS